MFDKILYPTDFSDVSQKALEFVKRLKEAGAQEVILLHVIDVRSLDAVARYAAGDFVEIEQKLQREVKEAMAGSEHDLTKLGFSVKIRIESGIPFREILRIEKEEKVSVIVIGSHGMSNIEEMLLGSVSEKVVRKASAPVFVVKR